MQPTLLYSVLLVLLSVSGAGAKLKIQSGNEEDWRAPLITTKVSIGDPKQNLTLAIDQNFEDILVVGESCRALACTQRDGMRTIYRPSQSNTANDTGYVVKLKYGRSIVDGEYVTDQIKVDGLDAARPLEIGVLSRASADFFYLQADGVFGLSFKDLVRGHGQFQSALHSLLSTVDKKQVNLWLNKATSNVDRYGNVTFGNSNSKYCKGKPAFYPNSFAYTFYIEKARFGSVESHRSIDTRVDFSSRFLAMPTLEYKQLWRSIGFNSPQSFDCSYVDGLNLELKIGGKYYVLTPDDYTYKDSDDYCHALFVDNGDYDQQGNGWVLGEPFLRNFCVHWDVSTTAIGFSPALSNKK